MTRVYGSNCGTGLAYRAQRALSQNARKPTPCGMGFGCVIAAQSLRRGGAEGLIDVGLDVLNVLQADGQPDVVGRDARRFLFGRS